MRRATEYMVAVIVGLVIAFIVTGAKLTVTPTPVTTPEPIPSYVWDMDPGCFAWGQPLALECLEGGAPLCDAYPDSACWSRDAQGAWYWPHGRPQMCPYETGAPGGPWCVWVDPGTGLAHVIDSRD